MAGQYDNPIRRPGPLLHRLAESIPAGLHKHLQMYELWWKLGKRCVRVCVWLSPILKQKKPWTVPQVNPRSSSAFWTYSVSLKTRPLGVKFNKWLKTKEGMMQYSKRLFIFPTLLDGSNVRLNWNIESDMNVNWIQFKNFLSLYWFKNKQHWI